MAGSDGTGKDGDRGRGREDSPDIIRFREEYRFLSNFYPALLNFGGLTILMPRRLIRHRNVWVGEKGSVSPV